MNRLLSLSIVLFFASVLVSTVYVASPSPVHADTASASDPYGLNTTASYAQFQTNNNPDASVNTLVSNIIKTILGITGVIFLGLIVYAGNLWMTAGGNEEQVRKARTMMVNAVIGIAAVFGAYVITNFVVDQIVGYVSGVGQ